MVPRGAQSQMLLVCEHMAEPEMDFTIWAAPVMAAAKTALPSLLNLPKVQLPSLPALTMQGVSTQSKVDPGLTLAHARLGVSFRLKTGHSDPRADHQVHTTSLASLSGFMSSHKRRQLSQEAE